MPVVKNDGGLIYPGKRKELVERVEHSDEAKAMGPESHFMGEVDYPGITRRNKLIDDLVVALSGDPETNTDWILQYGIERAIKIADATIAESNK